MGPRDIFSPKHLLCEVEEKTVPPLTAPLFIQNSLSYNIDGVSRHRFLQANI